MTKTTLLAATLIGAMALPASAGGLAEPIMQPVIIVEDIDEPASSSARNMPRIIFMLLTIVARIS